MHHAAISNVIVEKKNADMRFTILPARKLVSNRVHYRSMMLLVATVLLQVRPLDPSSAGVPETWQNQYV